MSILDKEGIQAVGAGANHVVLGEVMWVEARGKREKSSGLASGAW